MKLQTQSGFILPYVLHNIKGNTDREWVKGTRRPSARKPDPEFDKVPEGQESIILIIWRGFSSIEVIVSIENGKVREAYVTISEGTYKAGESISLTWEEEAEALRADREPQ